MTFRDPEKVNQGAFLPGYLGRLSSSNELKKEFESKHGETR